MGFEVQNYEGFLTVQWLISAGFGFASSQDVCSMPPGCERRAVSRLGQLLRELREDRYGYFGHLTFGKNLASFGAMLVSTFYL
jgi:hypothetical protein